MSISKTVSLARDCMQGSGNQIRREVFNRAVSCMFYVADILEFVVTVSTRPLSLNGILSCRFMNEFFMFLLNSWQGGCRQRKFLERFWACVAPVGEELPKGFGEDLVFQRITVIRVSRSEGTLYHLSTVVYGNVQLETVESSRGAFALGCPFPHGLMAVAPLDVTRCQRRGINYWYARVFAQCRISGGKAGSET